MDKHEEYLKIRAELDHMAISELEGWHALYLLRRLRELMDGLRAEFERDDNHPEIEEQMS